VHPLCGKRGTSSVRVYSFPSLVRHAAHAVDAVVIAMPRSESLPGPLK
jgi:hypothetical protein